MLIDAEWTKVLENDMRTILDQWVNGELKCPNDEEDE